MPELTITSPYVDSNTSAMGIGHWARVDLKPMPESALSPRKGLRIWPLAVLPGNTAPYGTNTCVRSNLTFWIAPGVDAAALRCDEWRRRRRSPAGRGRLRADPGVIVGEDAMV